MQWYRLYIPVNRCKFSEPSTVSECLLFCNLQLQPHWGTTFRWISGLSWWKHAWNTGWPWSMDNLGVESKIPRWYLKAQTTKWINHGKSGLFNESTNLQPSLSCHVPSSNHPTTSPWCSAHSALERLDGSATRDFTKASTTRRWRSLQLYRLHFWDFRENGWFWGWFLLVVEAFSWKKLG